MYENEEQARNAMDQLNKKGYHVSFAKVFIIIIIFIIILYILIYLYIYLFILKLKGFIKRSS